MSHSHYLRDLPSSDFDLLFTMKEKFERIQVRQEDQLFECLQEISKGINHDELNRVFRAWVKQVQETSQNIEEYIK
jgi:hypothetical protein